MKSLNIHTLIKRILKEEIDKEAAVSSPEKTQLRVPEMNGNGIDDTKKNKTFKSDTASKPIATKTELLDELTKVVNGIDKTISVMWDDHGDLVANAKDIKSIRITPRWDDYYVIEMITRNSDRVWVTGLDWEQVVDFVKINLKGIEKQPTYVDKAYDKSYRNRHEESSSAPKGIPQKDKPKTLPLTNESPKETKNKDKNYTEVPKDDDDLPNKPMKKVDEFKKQSDHKVSEPVKLRKHRVNTKLTVK